jgi:hypothetical protein
MGIKNRVAPSRCFLLAATPVAEGCALASGPETRARTGDSWRFQGTDVLLDVAAVMLSAGAR